MKAFGFCLLSLIAVAVLAFYSNGLSLLLKRTFGVADANADRRIFEQSQSYNEGMIRDLEHLQQQYVAAPVGERGALRALIIHRFEVYPEQELPADLRAFYSTIKMGAQ